MSSCKKFSMLYFEDFIVTIYSILETAKANGLSVEKYLVYLMDVLSSLENKDINKNTLLKYMPWFKELPPEVLLKNKMFIIQKSSS